MMGLPSRPRLGRRGQTNIGSSGAAACGVAEAIGGGCCVGGIIGGTGAIGAMGVIKAVPPPLPLPPLTPLKLVPQLLLVLLLLLLLPLPIPPLDTSDWAPTPEGPSAPAVKRKTIG